MFCPKCKSLLKPKNENGRRKMACACGYSEGAAVVKITETSKQKAQEIAIVEHETTVNTIVDAECAKCGPVKAEYWEIQTRSADEPPTRFHKCLKCEHTWREYR